MRTTLDIDEDVLAAAKELARRQRVSAGQVVSQLLRRALTGEEPPALPAGSVGGSVVPVAGFRPFPAGSAVVTNDDVNALREIEGV
ncbi:CopG family transcriptional regulator [Tahibacter sp.]|uniref:ribbon-helix-helix domain-containing protein n=1 Tax=Tahibacter sp. TaxID=2056211 RepID=UPI0028C4B28D|nr:CopG family transcriptional regulator [Tahibacter sp.]